MNCRQIVSVLASGDPVGIERGWEHISHCEQCRKGLDRLVQLLRTPENELSCGDCSDRLRDYILASPVERDTSPYLKAVGEHLELCPACQMEYDDLSAMWEAEHLLSEEPTPAPLMWLQIAQDVFVFSRNLFGLLTAPRAESSGAWGWVAVSVPRELLFTSLRGVHSEQQPYLVLHCPADLGIDLVIAYSSGTDTFTLGVEARRAGTETGASGAQVILSSGTHYFERREIDAQSKAIWFEDLSAREQYTLIVEYEGKRFELSVDYPAFEAESVSGGKSA